MAVAASKRAWIILLAILLIELLPFTIILMRSPAGILGRLYGFDAAHWPAWAGVLTLAAAYIGYAARAFPIVRQNLLTVNPMKLAAVVFAIVTGTVEEVYFRKFLMDWVAHQGAGAAVQIAGSAILFGLAHGIWGIFAKQWRMALGAGIATAILGAFLAAIYLAAGRHVAPCVWAHMLINLGIEPWLILAAASLGQPPAATG